MTLVPPGWQTKRSTRPTAIPSAPGSRRRRPQVLIDEIWNGALEDDAKAFGVDVPTHDVERIGPELFAGRFDPGGAAVAGAQDQPPRRHRRTGWPRRYWPWSIRHGAPRAYRARARPAAHWCPGRDSREPRRDRQPGHAAGATEAEDRNARHVAPQAKLAGDARVQSRRCDAGRAYRDDGIDLARPRDRRCAMALRATSRNSASAPSRNACVRSGQPRRSRYHSIGFTP